MLRACTFGIGNADPVSIDAVTAAPGTVRADLTQTASGTQPVAA